jgi:alpha-maltose-1-phosphate synthase
MKAGAEANLMTPAIYFHPEAYTTTGPKLMGRNAAGESFIRGFLKYSSSPEYWIQTPKRELAEQFAALVKTNGQDKPIKVVTPASLGELKHPGLVYHPGPGLGIHAFERAAFGHGAWSLCGITHTTSSAGAMDSITGLLTAPIQPWDALICTSTAVKQNVERLLQAQVDYLKDRFDIRKIVLPKFPVIPLGIHTQDFVFTDTDRAKSRQSLQIDEDTIVVLFIGRLSFHAKAHPLAMYQALERATKSTGKKAVLVECGWHANEFIANAFKEAAAVACPSVRVLTLDGRKPDERKQAWSCADIFCSLSDNIQETFGIAPIEAMAAGLPVVVSDWDGYKDTVRHEKDGFRIPTLMPPAGAGQDLSLRHALEIDTYDMYCGHTCSLISVDIDETTKAFERLLTSPDLREEMGRAGQQRARSTYDWSVVIRQYESLWQEQDAVRLNHSTTLKPLTHPWPARADPFYLFSNYPSVSPSRELPMELGGGNLSESIDLAKKVRALAMVSYAKAVSPSMDEIVNTLEAVSLGPKTAKDLCASLQEPNQSRMNRVLAWMLKFGLLKRTSSN